MKWRKTKMGGKNESKMNELINEERKKNYPTGCRQ